MTKKGDVTVVHTSFLNFKIKDKDFRVVEEREESHVFCVNKKACLNLSTFKHYFRIQQRIDVAFSKEFRYS